MHAGEVVALLGENGAGKSTLMKIVGGIEQPDAGELLIDGAPRSSMRDVHAATALGIAFIHQELNLLDNLDVAGNVLLGREPTRWGPLRLVDRAEDARDRAARTSISSGSTSRPDTPLAALSIAQQQLVEIAKALSLDAASLIMDEPTSSLTLAETARLHEVVAGLRGRGVASSTSPTASAKCAPSPIARSCCATARTPARSAREALTHDNMIGLMIGRDIDVAAPARNAVADGGEYFSVEGLRTRRYPQHAVSFAVGRGEILGLAGLVGAGRSELALAMFGVEPPLAVRSASLVRD